MNKNYKLYICRDISSLLIYIKNEKHVIYVFDIGGTLALYKSIKGIFTNDTMIYTCKITSEHISITDMLPETLKSNWFVPSDVAKSNLFTEKLSMKITSNKGTLQHKTKKSLINLNRVHITLEVHDFKDNSDICNYKYSVHIKSNNNNRNILITDCVCQNLLYKDNFDIVVNTNNKKKITEKNIYADELLKTAVYTYKCCNMFKHISYKVQYKLQNRCKTISTPYIKGNRITFNI